MQDAVDHIAAIPGVTWVMINITNGAFGDRFTAPLSTVESINPLSTPTRDLFQELVDAFDAEGIRVIAYIATQGPAMLKHGAERAIDFDDTIPNCKASRPEPTDADSQVYCSANMNRWRDEVLSLYTGTESLHTKFKMAMADEVVELFAVRYGNKIDGWWFDHAGFGDIPRLRSAALQGNANAIFAFNDGQKVPLTNNNPGDEDYTFGHPTPVAQAVPQDDVNLPMLESIENPGPIFYGPQSQESLGHMFMPFQEAWNNGQTVFSVAKASEWLDRATAAGGAITWSVAQEGDLSAGEPRVLASAQTELMTRAQFNRQSDLIMKFEGLSGTTAFDDSINSWTASATGGSTTADVARGNVLSLTGSDSLSVNGYKGVSGGAARSTSVWVKTLDDKGTIVDWGSSTNSQRWWLRLVNGKIKLILQNTNVVGTTAINDGQWHHIAVVATDDSISNIQVYVDGALESTTTTGGTMNTVVSADVVIGGDLEAELDNLVVHDRALSAAEVTYAASADSNLDLDLALDLGFDEPALSSTFSDSSVYGRDGIVQGAQTGVSDATRGSVFSFDGDDSLVVTPNTSDAAVSVGYNGVPGEEPRTIMAWIKTSDSGIIAQWGNHSAMNGEQFIFRVFNGVLRASVKGGNVNGTTNVADGNWHHVALVAPDNVLANLDLYVDGTLESSSVSGSQTIFDTYTVNSSYDPITQVVTLKSRDVLIGNQFIGSMDDLVIHQRALRDFEISKAAQ